MNNNLKMLVFWAVVLVAAIGIYFYAESGQEQAAAVQISGEWSVGGKADQPCAIFRQGEVLLIVNERGDVATGRMQGATQLVVVKGDGWESGLTAELRDGGKSLAWRDGSVWTRR